MKENLDVITHRVTYDSENRFILVEHFGPVDKLATIKTRTEALVLAKQYACFNVLADLRDASSALSIFDIFEMPEAASKALSESNLPLHPFKRAIVVSKDSDESSFFETVSMNRGHNVRVFYDIDSAKAWLSGS